MKNSEPMMKNKMMPVRMSQKELLRPKEVEISVAPFSRNTSSRLVSTMNTGLNLASQETMTAVKPRPPARVVVIVWSVPGDEQEARYAADGTGEQQRAHYHAVDLDADVARRPLALADDAYLIAVLAVLEVDVHEHRYDGDDEDVEEVLVGAYLGQPSRPCCSG